MLIVVLRRNLDLGSNLFNLILCSIFLCGCLSLQIELEVKRATAIIIFRKKKKN